MKNAVDKLTIKGFKSIKSLENFQLKNLNILIGGNGAGKSNFIDFFRLLRAMMQLSLPGLHNVNLQSFISDGGGISDFLFNGPKVTEQIEIEILFGDNGYGFKLAPTADEKVLVNDEKSLYEPAKKGWFPMGGGYANPGLLLEKNKKAPKAAVVLPIIYIKP